MSGRAGRNAAEWATFTVCSAIVLVVVGLLVSQLFGTEEPAAPVARQQGEIRRSAGHFFVPVDVINEGDVTAAEVQVVAELTIDGEVTDAEQRVDFLAGSETATLVFAFEDDPHDGELVVSVRGYSEP
jgi:uncharacterized protein (TIGR02588 family)